MRLLVLLFALAMPVVSWLSQSGAFGPDNGTISDRYPTLLVAAGYAFSIWGLIFLLDVVYGIWQATGRRRADPLLDRIAPATAAGFALTALWMPLFSQGLFWLCLLVIFGALASLAWAALQLSRAAPVEGGRLWAWLPLSLHAGWLSLAAFLNLAQVALAYGWTRPEAQLGASLLLFAIAAMVLLELNRRMRGNPAYVAAALWGLVAVWMKQSQSTLPGAQTAAWVAALIAAILLLQTVWLRWQRPRGLVAGDVRTLP
ncbi:hypothetical protein MNQ95_08665 [Pseudoxanthomonas daejeonensis]|uniref:Tryptophan-rich sensory protein n=1 Tax=Pseudoxanthomonas daejeonensis TaxID=266062 RepID=A0ABQ6Z7L5_9GAMM|nr:hypothetical protein [Pseudoxanthomonas daejeonensis]KAF1694983.1 hypothetical protein CSC65_07110 [Pseudoxanthomonas daejeonensis]UNK56249.1 hypothetical protein MNQ95_08665 [Pseudoxanthomonas daejeonensis]